MHESPRPRSAAPCSATVRRAEMTAWCRTGWAEAAYDSGVNRLSVTTRALRHLLRLDRTLAGIDLEEGLQARVIDCGHAAAAPPRTSSTMPNPTLSVVYDNRTRPRFLRAFAATPRKRIINATCLLLNPLRTSVQIESVLMRAARNRSRLRFLRYATELGNHHRCTDWKYGAWATSRPAKANGDDLPRVALTSV